MRESSGVGYGLRWRELVIFRLGWRLRRWDGFRLGRREHGDSRLLSFGWLCAAPEYRELTELGVSKLGRRELSGLAAAGSDGGRSAYSLTWWAKIGYWVGSYNRWVGTCPFSYMLADSLDGGILVALG